MFQFAGFPTCNYGFITCWLPFKAAGFPHSDIHGSMFACNSPWLFAAYHVLLRLLMPRHSPCALLSLIFFSLPFSVSQKVHLIVFHCISAMALSNPQILDFFSQNHSYYPILFTLQSFLAFFCILYSFQGAPVKVSFHTIYIITL